jgi:GNAT superfamily N-acetyltransferase
LAQDSLTNSSSTYKFLILERGNKIIAYTCYGKIPATEASFDLYWIVTDKDYQGQGIGKYIINKTHNLIRTLGGRLLYAETSGLQKYASTRKFYLSCAYKEAPSSWTFISLMMTNISTSIAYNSQHSFGRNWSL